MLFINSSGAEVYKWVDEKGNVYYGDDPPAAYKPEQIEITPDPSEENIQRAREKTERLIHQQKPRKEVSKFEKKTDQWGAKQGCAAECFSSPADVIGSERADPFVAISPRLLTRAEYNKLSAMFRTLQGSWNGDIEEVVCLGTEHAPRSETRRYAVKAKAKRDLEDVLRIASDVMRVDTRTHHQQVLWLLLNKNWLRFGDRNAVKYDAPQWDVEVVSIETNTLLFVRKFRRRGLRHLELRSLHASHRSFLIREWFYAQGVLGLMRTWILKK